MAASKGVQVFYSGMDFLLILDLIDKLDETTTVGFFSNVLLKWSKQEKLQ